MANLLIIERALDGNGNVAAGAKATVYLTGTTTLVTVYSDKDGTISAANPIIADANGFWPQRFVTVNPKVVVTTATDATIYTLDPAPVTFGTGAAAAGVSFAPTVEVPEDNVQDAIESVAGSVLSGVTAFGIGVTGNAPLLANIDATGTASGVYRWDGASTGTFPAGITASTTGLIDFDRQTAAEGMQTLRALGQSRSYQRFMTSTAWGAWRETPTLPATFGTAGQLVRVNAGATEMEYSDGIAVQSTVAASGQTSISFTGIPAWADRINIHFLALSTSASSSVMVRLGDSGGIENSGYNASSTVISTSVSTANAATGFLIDFGVNDAAAASRHGSMILQRITGNSWACTGMFALSNTGSIAIVAGGKTTTGTVDRIAVTTVNGTDTFDVGQVSISWE